MFCDIWGIEGTVLVDESGEYARALQIRGVPTNVFVDSDGRVTAVGGVAPSALEAEIRRLLGPDAVIDDA
jgi:predicted DsbA family dithiol-disulfide isomerase